MTISQAMIIAWIKAFAALIAENKDYLTELDSAIGDADHGTNMHRGMQAFIAKLPEVTDKDIGTIFKTLGMILVSTVGGSAGPLYGTFFLQMGMMTANKQTLTLADFTAAFEAGLKGVMARGKAQPGEKTMLDALDPPLSALKDVSARNESIANALQAALIAAETGRDATIPMQARKGRASYLGERSIGHQDPGATSATMLLAAAVSAWP